MRDLVIKDPQITMCGRFALRLSRDEVRHLPGYDNVEVDEWVDENEFVPRYNIAPRTQAPVIRRRNDELLDTATISEKLTVTMHTMKWGLVPHWSKFEDKTLSTTNARSENLVEGGGMWGSIKGKRRCAIPVQGYYEWLTKGKDKLPHFTKRKDGKLMLMAGLYDCATIEGRSLWTFTIVTADANKDFSWLHDRQPVILSTSEAINRWLDTSSQTWSPELTDLVQPYHNPLVPLECYQVPKEVGKVGTESPRFIEPIANRKDGIEAMFSKQKASTKRKRSFSPTMQINDKVETVSPGKRVKEEDVEQFGGSIEAIETHKPKSNLSPRKRKPPTESASKAVKITSFFNKA